MRLFVFPCAAQRATGSNEVTDEVSVFFIWGLRVAAERRR